MARLVGCLTFDFDVVSGWISRDLMTPTPMSRGEFGLIGRRRIPALLENPTPPFAFQRQLEATYTLKTWDRLPAITAPTLVVTGAKDVLIPAENSERLASRIPGARLYMIAGAGHGFQSEARAEFLGVFTPFLKEHPVDGG